MIASGSCHGVSLRRTLHHLSSRSSRSCRVSHLGTLCWTNSSITFSLSTTNDNNNNNCIIFITSQRRARSFSTQPTGNHNGSSLNPILSVSECETQQQQEQQQQQDTQQQVVEESTDHIGSSHDPADAVVSGCGGGWDHDIVAELFANSSDWLTALPPVLATSLADHEPVMEYKWYNHWTKYIMDGVHFVHDETGLTYASCIMIFTALARLALMPLAIWSRRHESYRDALHEQIRALREVRATTPQMRQRVNAEVDRLRNQSKYIWQYRMIYPVTQTLAILFMFIGLRQMCNFYPDEFEEGML